MDLMELVFHIMNAAAQEVAPQPPAESFHNIKNLAPLEPPLDPAPQPPLNPAPGPDRPFGTEPAYDTTPSALCRRDVLRELHRLDPFDPEGRSAFWVELGGQFIQSNKGGAYPDEKLLEI